VTNKLVIAPQEPHSLASPDGLMDPRAAADFLGVSVLTLADWRVKGKGPVYTRAGGRLIKYRRSSLEAWIESRTQRSTAENAKGA
jgi:predicted DNA-binding transcriptional regulator AlpA